MVGVLAKEKANEAVAAAGITGDGAVRSFVKSHVSAFYGDFFRWVNVLGVTLQIFAVSRNVRFGGLRVAFLVLPVIAISTRSPSRCCPRCSASPRAASSLRARSLRTRPTTP